MFSYMDGRRQSVIADLKQVADNARTEFGGLSAAQLNWKPAENSWSVAQCFDHLITTHSLYFPLFDKLAQSEIENTFFEKYSPLSGFFGRFLIKSLRPENLKKMKTTSLAQPSSSEIDAEIIDKFCEHQKQLIGHIERLPGNLDPGKTIVTSPLMGLVTYSLADCYTILVVHCQRHRDQAKRVMNVGGFPK
jgi:hypothetical protein